MIEVTCKVRVIEIDGVPVPKEAMADMRPSVIVESYPAKGCGENEYVTLRLPGVMVTVRADDLIVAAKNAARTSDAGDDIF